MKKTIRIIRPINDDKRDKRLISKLPTNMLIDNRLVNVNELKKDENNSIRNRISKKE